MTGSGEKELTDLSASSFALFSSDTERKGIRRELRSHLYQLIDIDRNAIVLKSKAAEERADQPLIGLSAVGTLCFLIAFTLF